MISAFFVCKKNKHDSPSVFSSQTWYGVGVVIVGAVIIFTVAILVSFTQGAVAVKV